MEDRSHGRMGPPGLGAGDGRGLCAPYTPPLESVTSLSLPRMAGSLTLSWKGSLGRSRPLG